MSNVTEKAAIIALLQENGETANRQAYTRHLAGKPAGAPLQFIRKEFKNQAHDEDYSVVLDVLATAALGALPEAETIEAEAAQVVAPEAEVPAAPKPAGRELVFTDHLAGVQFLGRRAMGKAPEQPAADQASADFVANALALVSGGVDDNDDQGGAPAGTPGPSIIVNERPALVVDARPALVTSYTSPQLVEILAAPVPATTRTYTPLAHADLIELVHELLDKRGLKVKDQGYTHNRMGQQMFGHMTVEGWNVEQDMSIGFRNSYDKSMQAGVVAGGRVVVCSNMMFVGQFKATKMHYGNISNELREAVSLAIDNLETNYRQLQVDTQKLQSVKVDERLIHEILGELFFKEAIVTETQLKVLRNELREQVRFGAETVWDIYNHTTEALKSTPAGQMVDRHVAAHEFYLAKA